jgi:type VI secretion system FHA domain protein
LPDPYVSSRHALIRYQEGVFYIEDTSTNGVFINSPDNRLTKGQPYALKSGDWIFIEPYEIRASLTPEANDAASSPLNDLFPVSSVGPASTRGLGDFGDDLLPRNPVPPRPVPPARSDNLYAADRAGGDDDDPFGLIESEPRRTPPPAPNSDDLKRAAPWEEQFDEPPAPVPAAPRPVSGASPPPEYDPMSDSAVMPAPPRPASPASPASGGGADVRPPRPAPPSGMAPTPARTSSTPGAAGRSAPAPPLPPPSAAPPRSRDEGVLAEVLAGAGLERVAVTPELARNIGQIFRVVVQGVIDVLESRQEVKGEFRIDVTTFKRAHNNPLKFSADADHALRNLFVERTAAFLGPVEAFQDAFDDVRHHQMAMLAGMQVAFNAMLTRFDPDRLQEEFDRQLKGAMIAAPGRLRYWDQYRAWIHDMVKDPEKSFRQLFGKEFADAYEQQLERLKAQSRAGQRGTPA